MRLYIKAATDDSLAFSPDSQQRAEIARTTDDISLLEIYALDPVSDVRLAVAENPNTRDELLPTLTEGIHDGTRYNILDRVVKHPNLSTTTLLQLYSDDYWNDRATDAVIDRYKTDPEGIYAAPKDLKVRLAILVSNPKILSIFSKDYDPDIRKWVANNSHCSISTYADLVKDPVDDVRLQLAENAAVPIPILAKLVNDPYWMVRSYLVDNKSIALSILKLLAQDEDEYIREKVLENPKYQEANL